MAWIQLLSSCSNGFQRLLSVMTIQGWLLFPCLGIWVFCCCFFVFVLFFWFLVLFFFLFKAQVLKGFKQILNPKPANILTASQWGKNTESFLADGRTRPALGVTPQSRRFLPHLELGEVSTIKPGGLTGSCSNRETVCKHPKGGAGLKY